MNYRVLIIEDEIDTSKYLALALEMEAIAAVCADNGAAGLRYLQEQEFDLIVLDLKMPNMDGVEVLREIRKQQPYIPVIVYTNYGDFATTQSLINLGVDGFIPKGATADLGKLVQVIKSKLLPMDETERRALLDQFFKQFPVGKNIEQG